MDGYDERKWHELYRTASQSRDFCPIGGTSYPANEIINQKNYENRTQHTPMPDIATPSLLSAYVRCSVVRKGCSPSY
jgi:hypothetical protein